MNTVWNNTVWKGMLFDQAWIFASAGAAAAAVIVAVMALMVGRAVRSRPAPMRYGLLLAALVVLGIVPAVAVASRLAGWAVVTVPAAAVDRPLDAGSVVATTTARRPTRPAASAADMDFLPSEHVEETAGAPVGMPTFREMASCLLWVWFGGIVFFVGVVVRDLVRLRRLGRSLVPCTIPAAMGLLDEAARAVGLTRPPRLFESAAMTVPVVIGPVAPVIVLPTGMADTLDREKLSAVLVHEAAHVVHGDLWVGLLQHAVAAVFWWCPFVHRLNRRLAEVREEICDDYVVVAQGDGFELAEVLVEMAAGLRGKRERLAIGALGAIDEKPALEGRVERLVDLTRKTAPVTRMNRLAIAAAGTFGAVALAIVLATTIHAADEPADLLRRLKERSLTPDQIEAAIDRGLAVQADRRQEWTGEWGDFIEAARAAGQVSDDCWQQYARNAVTAKLTARAKVRRGDPLPVCVELAWARAGTSSPLQLVYDDSGFEVNGHRLTKTGGLPGMSLRSENGVNGWTGRLLDLAPLLPELEDGPQTVRVAWNVTESEDVERATRILPEPQHFEAKFELLSADQPSVAVRQDPKLAADIRSLLSAEIWPRDPADEELLRFFITVSPLPIGVSFDAYVRVDGTETKIGSFAAPAPAQDQEQGLRFQLDARVPGVSADRMDLVLEPNPDAAARSVDVFEIWDGTIVIPVRERQ